MMREQFVSGGDVEINYETVASGIFIDSDGDQSDGTPGIVAHDAPWATITVEVEGGYMVFESMADYKKWNQQQLGGNIMKTKIFGRINDDGNVDILNTVDGSAVTRIDANVYPVNSDLSARYEHPEGIVLTIEDAQKLEIEFEETA